MQRKFSHAFHVPGTLSADIRGDTLVVHVLDRNLPTFEQLRRLELAVARMFGCPLGPERSATLATHDETAP